MPAYILHVKFYEEHAIEIEAANDDEALLTFEENYFEYNVESREPIDRNYEVSYGPVLLED